VAAGRDLFRSLACADCHTIQGLTVGRYPGAPELTYVALKRTIAGGSLRMTEEDLRRFITDPLAAKPGTAMPDLGLDDDTVTKIVRYLLTLK
jgi:cytochrome c oxidase subunit 2